MPRITFTGEPATETLARQRLELWPPGDAGAAADWAPRPDDLLFVAGVDWRYLAAGGFDALPNPRINLIQHVRHAHEGTELYGYLANRAVRICVSREVADAITATGRVNGPVLTIPNGIEAFSIRTFAGAAGSERRPVVIAGYKEPVLAKSLSDRLAALGIEHTLLTEFLAREKFLERLAGSRVAVCLPRAEEGFYLPALEAMAAGCLVVTLDCVGNRSFCTHDGNCLIADPTADSLAVTVQAALGLGANEGQHLRSGGADTVREYSLEAERRRFHAVLRDIDRHWLSRKMVPTGHPRVNFMIIGAQKCGTTALAHFLAQHPRIRMSSEKEPHLFDAPDYSPKWTPEQIDERYRPYFNSPGVTSSPDGTPTFSPDGTPTVGTEGTPAIGNRALDEGTSAGSEGTPTVGEEGTPTIGKVGPHTLRQTAADGRLRGEATPIYLFLPEIAPELKRYNPELKVIILLRNPVERAISHYYMEKNKGHERFPLWLALLVESWRLWRCGDRRQHGSAWRRHSYRRRGLYSVQLRNLFRYFDATQVLLVRAEDLARFHDEALKRVFEFLEVDDYTGIEAQTVFEGERGDRRHVVVSWLLRMSYLPEFIRMRRFRVAAARE
ncbi:MAG: sulfotransferase domain-containing protein [Gammaproteobacteria bacterium]|nr:sulfotransferase domain-containing protein [Gammaproteobacteria bacterium]